MKSLKLSGSLRENVGKKGAKALRKEEKVPCVLYGGEKQIHFSLLEKAFKPIVFTPNVFVLEIDIDGTTHRAILQDIQYHPVHDGILHADFLEITGEKAVAVSLPVIFEGNPKGVLNGGRLVKKMRKIRVSGIVDQLPDTITLDISDLAIHDSIRIKDLEIEHAILLDTVGSVIVAVNTARGAAEDEEEEGEEGEEGEGEAAPAAE